MKKNKIFKTSISRLIYIYWILMFLLVIVILYHFFENPFGLSILLSLIILPVFFNPIYSVIVRDNEIKVTKKNGFFFTSKRVFQLKELSKVNVKIVPLSFATGSIILQGDAIFSLLFHALTGIIFYQSTAILEIYSVQGKLIELYKVNIGYKDAKFLNDYFGNVLFE